MENNDVNMPEKVVEDKDKVLPVKQRKHRKKQMYISLKKQMEFYLGKKNRFAAFVFYVNHDFTGDANLQKDRFLSKLIQEDACKYDEFIMAIKFYNFSIFSYSN